VATLWLSRRRAAQHGRNYEGDGGCGTVALERAFLNAHIMHARHAPKKHVLNYKVWYLCVDVSAMKLLNAFKLFSRNKRNIYSLYDADYGMGNSSCEAWIETIKHDYNVAYADGETTLITMPRMMLYGFNPVSFWFMKDTTGCTRAVLAEVNNTFGERHCYLCRHDDGRVIEPDDWLHADKVFHVSPFMKVSGTYDFKFSMTESDVAIWINHNDNGQRMLTTSLIGARAALTNGRLFSAFWQYPLLTLKVIALIHWHAIRLLIKGIRYNNKPQPPTYMVSK
jgi:DUF1365 family protein